MNRLKAIMLGGGHRGVLLSANDKIAKELDVPQLTEQQAKAGRRQAEQIAAYDRLMNGPKATRPTGRAVRKVIGRIRAGLSLNGSWRSWPSTKQEF